MITHERKMMRALLAFALLVAVGAKEQQKRLRVPGMSPPWGCKIVNPPQAGTCNKAGMLKVSSSWRGIKHTTGSDIYALWQA